ncbi:MAG: cytochrome [Anaerocolumna sp.]|jgi:predicted heme/steroid binding protein|nr:cytochrome [Anaerocolumna sp.]
MHNPKLVEVIYQYKNEICFLNQMKILSTSTNEINNYNDKMEERTNQFIEQIEQVMNENEARTDTDMLREFTLEELAVYNGTNGNPPFVAVNGTVYDMSSITLWSGGRHFGMIAGRDLSQQFITCHQGITTRLEKLPIVGKVSGTVN